jgi:hypothetical protein
MMEKALSIRQPWAWLIINGGKDIENRTWRTTHRGQFWVHASLKPDLAAWETLTAAGVYIPTMDRLKYGGIIGRAEIVDCVTKSDSPWFIGPIGFVLKNPMETTFRKCRGRLSFFSLK